MSATAQLLEAIRSEALPGVWTRGVNLARDGAVLLESRTGSEVVMRVKVAGRPVALSAILYPADESWECDCPGKVDPCEHVVAAAITLNQAASHDAPLETAGERFSRVVYRFSRADDGLLLHRFLA
ncbi:MAG: SWIM zinc finger family protein, partial [Myxococcales bacterium]